MVEMLSFLAFWFKTDCEPSCTPSNEESVAAEEKFDFMLHAVK